MRRCRCAQQICTSSSGQGQDEGTAPGIRVRVPGRGIGRGNTAREQGQGTKHVVLDGKADVMPWDMHCRIAGLSIRIDVVK